MNSYWVRKLPDSILCYQEQPGISACGHGRGGASLLPCVPQHTWVHRPHTLHTGTPASHTTHGDPGLTHCTWGPWPPTPHAGTAAPHSAQLFAPQGSCAARRGAGCPRAVCSLTSNTEPVRGTAPLSLLLASNVGNMQNLLWKKKKNTQKFSNLYFFSWTKYLRELE